MRRTEKNYENLHITAYIWLPIATLMKNARCGIA